MCFWDFCLERLPNCTAVYHTCAKENLPSENLASISQNDLPNRNIYQQFAELLSFFLVGRLFLGTTSEVLDLSRKTRPWWKASPGAKEQRGQLGQEGWFHRTGDEILQTTNGWLNGVDFYYVFFEIEGSFSSCSIFQVGWFWSIWSFTLIPQHVPSWGPQEFRKVTTIFRSEPPQAPAYMYLGDI